MAGTRISVLAVVLAVAALLTGCGGSSPPPHPAARPSPSPGSPASTVHDVAGGSADPASTAAPLPSASLSPSSDAEPNLPADAFVRVAVASVWRSPGAVRAVDGPALAVPADVRGWLSAMTLAQRKDLVGRLDTQVLLGDRVVVVERRGGWARVVVPGQATPLDARGYPGWVPALQLTFRRPPAASTEAVVTKPTTWLSDGVNGRPVIEVSMATRLPVVADTTAGIDVAMPDSGSLRVDRSAVSVVPQGGPAIAADPGDVVRTARLFDGLPYLWGGTSGFGFDCSGLTYLDYRVHGIAIPRDADAQAVAGTPVAENDLRPGDLLFFAKAGVVHHVAMAVDATTMVQSPQTGGTVEVVRRSTSSVNNEFHGARRYLG